MAHAQLRLAGAGTIVDASVLEFLRVRHGETAILDPGRADRGPRDHLRAVGQIADSFSRGELAANTLSRYQDLCAKPARLFARAFRELGPADPLGKAEIVLDPGAAARLAPNRPSLDADGLEPLRRAVNSRAQAGGPRPVDGQVIFS